MRTIILLTVCALCIAGCASEPLRSWPEIRGRVLDAETDAPIEGAIVNLYTQGFAPVVRNSVVVDHRFVCYNIETAKTDVNGDYSMPAWTEIEKFAQVKSSHRVGVVFRSGYLESRRTEREQSMNHGIYYLKKFRGTRKDWFDYLEGRVHSTACGYAGKMELRVIPMLEAVLRDARELAIEPEEKKVAEWLESIVVEIREDNTK